MGFDKREFSELIDKLLINPKNKNGQTYVLEMLGEVDVIFSSQEQYKMSMEK